MSFFNKKNGTLIVLTIVIVSLFYLFLRPHIYRLDKRVVILTDQPLLLYVARVFNQEHLSKDSFKKTIDVEYLPSNELLKAWKTGHYDLIIARDINQSQYLRNLKKLPLNFSNFLKNSPYFKDLDYYNKLAPLVINPMLFCYNIDKVDKENKDILSLKIGEYLSFFGKSYNTNWQSPTGVRDLLIATSSGQSNNFSFIDNPVWLKELRERDTLVLPVDEGFYSPSEPNYFDILHPKSFLKALPISLPDYIQAISSNDIKEPLKTLVLKDNQNNLLSRSILFIGISLRLKDKALTNSFLYWITEEENQKKILDFINHKHIDMFGFLGGLSLFPRINEEALPSVLNERLLNLPYRYPRISLDNYNSFIKDNYSEIDPLLDGTPKSQEEIFNLYNSWLKKLNNANAKAKN